MCRRPQGNHSPSSEAKAALAAVEGEQTLAGFARWCGFHTSQIMALSTQLLVGAAGVFGAYPAVAELDSRSHASQPHCNWGGGMTETIARLHIALADTDPIIWRRVDFPVDANLKMLHDVIDGTMGWLEFHLWEFEADDRRYGVPDPDWPGDRLFAGKSTMLKTLLERNVHQFLYTCDMGDNWEHIVTVEAVEDGQSGCIYPRYVEGEYRSLPEDWGGTPGLKPFLTPSRHPEHKDVTEWHQGCYGKAFNPDEFDERDAKLRIGAIAKRRAAGKVAQARKSR